MHMSVVVHDEPGIDVEVTYMWAPMRGKKLVRIHNMPVFPDPAPLLSALEASIPVLQSEDIEAVAQLEETWLGLRARALD